MKKTALISLSIFAFIALLAWLGSSGARNPVVAGYSDSSLSAPVNSFDFETISMEDGDVEHNFELTNNGTEPVVITKVYTSCMCTTAYIYDSAGNEYGYFGMQGHGRSPVANVTVQPGESATVRAVFDPAAHGPSGIGLASRNIYLETNSSHSPKMELSFRAMVTR
ncbi:MAG: DUF1573 domain-containing protein [Candidatus Spechtbacterales bacterium]|nr:DUF1573 domain-containing protein [Candidatus Spechtbacterales bacterium]